MSSVQRNVSTPLELHQLNLVNKQKVPPLPARRRVQPMEEPTIKNMPIVMNDETSFSPEKFPPVTPKKNLLAPVTPVKQPIPEIKNPDDDENSIIYRLASKKREINELEEKLKYLKLELNHLEIEFRESQPQMVQSQLSSRQTQFQETFDGLKSKFNNTINSFTAPQPGNDNVSTQQNRNGNTNINGNISQTNRFFKGIMDKFNEFNVGEDEFDSKTRRDEVSNAYYLKQGYNVDDEEIENDAHDEAKFLDKIDDSTLNAIRR